MKKINLRALVVLMVVVILGLTFALSPVLADNSVDTGNAQNYAPDQVIIKYKASATNIEKDVIKAQKSLHKEKTLFLINGELVKITNGKKVQDVIDQLNKEANVEYAQPNYIYHTDAITNDTYSGILWGLNNTGQSVNGVAGVADIDIDAPEAWNITKGTADTVVAVIDTGVDINHPDLAANIWTNPSEIAGDRIDNDGNGYVDDVHGWDFLHNDNSLYNVNDGDDHGTHTSGTIAALANNGIGVAGVAPNVKIMPLKFIGPSGGYTSDAIEAINYAKNMGAKLASNSWGGGAYDLALYNAIVNFGKPFIASAGNSSANSDVAPEYPAAYDCGNIISVAAVDNRGNLASFSNFGATSVDVAAPGVDVASTVPGGYAFMSGTSMAAPHVSGVAALLLSVNPNLTSAEVKGAIINTVDPLASVAGKTLFGGMVNAYKAVAAVNLVPDTTAPTVGSTDPTSGSTGVFTSKTITINFSENVAPGATYYGISLSDGTNVLPVTCSITGNKLTIVPASALTYSTTYTIKLPAGAVNDIAGNALANDYNFTFSTGADTTGPVLVSTDPANKTTGVPVTKLIIINFNENISAVNLNVITVKKSKTSIKYTGTVSGNTLTIKPISNLPLGSNFTVAIPAGAVKDLVGNANASSYSFSFTTARR